MDFLEFLPQKSSITKLIIVGPYPSYSYIKNLISKKIVAKDNLHIIVDDGWDVDAFEDKGFNVKRVCAGDHESLVHAKMYYIEFSFCRGVRSLLIIGSANATDAGMHKNAEVLACYCLNDVTNKESVKQYFYNLCDGLAVEELCVQFEDSYNQLVLPAIDVADEETFDYWLKRGYLFYKFDKDPTFGVINIPLKKALPSGVDFEGTIFSRPGSNERKILRCPYLKDLENEGKENAQLKIYGMETNWGFWLSKKCVEKKCHEIFPEKVGYQLLENVLEKEKTIKDIISKVIDDINKIKNKQPEVADCFYELDFNKIKNIIEKRIELDKKKASDDNFVFRYTTGYAQNRIPRLEGDDWIDFKKSFFDSCKMKALSKKCKNRFAKRMRDLLNLASNQELYDLLENLENYILFLWNVRVNGFENESLELNFAQEIKDYYLDKNYREYKKKS